MRAVLCLTIAGFALLVTGCCGHSRSASAPIGAFGNRVRYEPSQAGVSVVAIVLNENQMITTKHNLLLHAEDNTGRNYDVLFGPARDTVGEASASMHHSEAEVEVEAGYALAIGYRPIITTHRVKLYSTGTTLVAHATPTFSRMFVLHSSSSRPATATFPAFPGEVSLSAGFYIEVTDANNARNLPRPMPIAGAPDEIVRFLADVEKKRKFAGLPATSDSPTGAAVSGGGS